MRTKNSKMRPRTRAKMREAKRLIEQEGMSVEEACKKLKMSSTTWGLYHTRVSAAKEKPKALQPELNFAEVKKRTDQVQTDDVQIIVVKCSSRNAAAMIKEYLN